MCISWTRSILVEDVCVCAHKAIQTRQYKEGTQNTETTKQTAPRLFPSSPHLHESRAPFNSRSSHHLPSCRPTQHFFPPPPFKTLTPSPRSSLKQTANKLTKHV